ncbi:MAG TPA: ABC transporter substrate-binding protein [Geobacteraceae bacterium]
MVLSRYHLLVALILLALVYAGPAPAQTSVTAEVKQVVDRVITVVCDKELQQPANEQKRQRALKEAIGAIFDYAEMAERSLGRHWKGHTPAEHAEFVRLFETLLENSYAGVIESYSDEKISYLQETVEGDYAEVKSKVVTAKREEFAIDYRLMKKGGRWVVYDVVNEGVSLIDNYKSQFNKIILKEGYEELIKKMKSKKEEITAPQKGFDAATVA